MKYLTSVFALEDLQDRFPKSFIDERPEFARADYLKSLRMNPEKENQHFVEQAQLVIDAMGVEVIEKEDSNRAYFNKGLNQIVIPPRHRFDSDEARMAVILHELSHSTMIPLDRDFGISHGESRKAKVNSSKEEVVAEMTTMFLTAELGMKSFNAHAKYIKRDCDVVCEDNNDKVLITLSTKAMQAFTYITDRVNAHKLKLTLDNDLVSKNDLVIDGNILIQKVEFADEPSKRFSVAIDVNNIEKGEIKVNNKDLFNEYVANKKSDLDPKELEDNLKDGLKWQLIDKVGFFSYCG